MDTNEEKKKMEAVLERFKGEMSKVRTGRAHPDMLASIKVEAYGQFMPLNQVANVTISDATMLLVTPFDPATINNITHVGSSKTWFRLTPPSAPTRLLVSTPPMMAALSASLFHLLPRNAAAKSSKTPPAKLKKLKSPSATSAKMLEKISRQPNFLKTTKSAPKKKSTTLRSLTLIKLTNYSRLKKPKS